MIAATAVAEPEPVAEVIAPAPAPAPPPVAKEPSPEEAEVHRKAQRFARLLVDEIAASLSAQERHVYTWKEAGFSSQEIARYRGTSAAAVDTMFHRAKQKARAMVLGARRAPSREKGGGAT